MRDAPRINYESSEDVKLRKVATLTKHYENFTMKEGKIIDEMFGRFQTFLNGLQGLGHEFTKAQNNMKILENFHKKWEPKTTTIQEAQNIATLMLDEMLGALRVHNVHLQNCDQLHIDTILLLRLESRIAEKKKIKSCLRS